DGGKDWFRLHHHSLPSTEGRIVDDMMLVLGPIAQIMNAKIDNSIFLRPFHHAFAQRRAANFRKQGQDVDLHTAAAVCDRRPIKFPLQKNHSTISRLARWPWRAAELARSA